MKRELKITYEPVFVTKVVYSKSNQYTIFQSLVLNSHTASRQKTFT